MKADRLDVGTKNLISDCILEAMERRQFFTIGRKRIPAIWTGKTYSLASGYCATKTNLEVCNGIPCLMGVWTAVKIGNDVRRKEIVENLVHKDNRLEVVNILDFEDVQFVE